MNTYIETVLHRLQCCSVQTKSGKISPSLSQLCLSLTYLLINSHQKGFYLFYKYIIYILTICRQVFLENEKILLATTKSSLLTTFKLFPSIFKQENLEVSRILEKSAKQTKLNRGIKRCATDGVVKKGSILDIFQKRSKTEGFTLLYF